MTRPYELYLRFLATKGIDDISEMNGALSKLDLGPITQEDIDRQWELLNRVLPKNLVEAIYKKFYIGSDFIKYMRILEVEELWYGELSGIKNPPVAKKTLENMYRLFSEPWLIININALLLKKVSIQEIARILSAKFSMVLQENSLDIYSKYFWGIDRLTRKELRQFINSLSGKARQVYLVAFTECVDTLKTELELPAIISVSDSLQWLLTKSLQKAKVYMNQNSVEAGREAREWTDQVLRITDKYEKYRSGDQQDFAKALQMEFTFVEEEFDSPDEDTARELKEKTAVKEE